MKEALSPPGNGKTPGQRLKEVRNLLRMNQSQLAATLGVSRNTISEIESDRAPLRSEYLITLHQTFNVSINYLVLGMRFVDFEGALPPHPDFRIHRWAMHEEMPDFLSHLVDRILDLTWETLEKQNLVEPYLGIK